MVEKVFMLVSGELIIAQVNEEELSEENKNLFLTTKNANNIVIDHQQHGIALVPMGTPLAKNDVKIVKSSISWLSDPVKELKNQYVASVSGIITPSSHGLKLST